MIIKNHHELLNSLINIIRIFQITKIRLFLNKIYGPPFAGEQRLLISGNQYLLIIFA